jgi:hypothetical protein
MKLWKVALCAGAYLLSIRVKLSMMGNANAVSMSTDRSDSVRLELEDLSGEEGLHQFVSQRSKMASARTW